MEKICIVRRRREYAQPEIKVTVAQPETSEANVSETLVSRAVAEKNREVSTQIIPEFIAAQTELNKTIIPETIPTDMATESSTTLGDKKIVEEFTDNSASVISIVMTKEQSALLKESEYIKEILSGAKNDPALDIKLTPDGRLCFNYRFKDSLLVRMLAPAQVCQMLQVSRSFLQKIVSENKLKSYKLGKMRRFLLEDILEYLSSESEFAQFNNEK